MANKKYTKEMEQWLRDNAKNKYTKEICEEFDKRFNTKTTISAMWQQLYRLGIKTNSKKGKQPYNKGKKWDEWMSKEGQINSFKTTFKKGSIPHNTLPVGTEIIDKFGYIWVRCATPQNKSKSHTFWIRKNQLIYEQHYGKIPENHCVIFADGDKRNFNIGNLILVSKDEQIYMNLNKLYFKGFSDITKSGALIAKIHFKQKELIKCRETH